MIIISNSLSKYIPTLFNPNTIKFQTTNMQELASAKQPQIVPRVVVFSTNSRDLQALSTIKQRWAQVIIVLIVDQSMKIQAGVSVNYLFRLGAIKIPPQREGLLMQTFGIKSEVGCKMLIQRLHDLDVPHTYLPNSVYFACPKLAGSFALVTLLEKGSNIPQNKYDINTITHQGKHYMIVGVPFDKLSQLHKITESLELKLVQGLPCADFPLPYDINHTYNIIYTDNATAKTLTSEQLAKRFRDEYVYVHKYLNQKMKDP